MIGKTIKSIETYTGDLMDLTVFYMTDGTIFGQPVIAGNDEMPEFFKYSKQQLADEIKHNNLEEEQ